MSKFRQSKILCVILAIATIATLILPLGSFTAFASSEDDYEYVSFAGSAYIQKYVGNDENVEIPSTLGGNTVTAIDDYVFRNCETVKNVTIPDTVTRIDLSAFEGCVNLETVNLPNSLTYLGGKAFYGCESLTTITIPASVTYIGPEVFAWCSSLTEINVDSKSKGYTSVDGVLMDIGKTRIMNVPAAKECEVYTVPTTVHNINKSAFAGCTKIKSIVLPPDAALYIYEYAFAGCTGLTSINLPSNIVSIYDYAFDGCTSLKKFTVDPKNANFTTVNGVLFNKTKTRLYCYPRGKTDATYTIPNTVNLIDERAFYGADNLTKLVVPNSVETIREDAFLGCDNLTIYAKSESYAYKYATDNGINVVSTDIIKSISHTVKNGKLIFTLVTYAGDYNRVKLTTPDNLGGSLAVASTYTVNEDGDYVWTVKTAKPKVTTGYTFDFRSSETGKYLKDYTNYTAEIFSSIREVSYKRTNGKVIFTVTTYAGDFNRIKVTLDDDLAGYVAYSDTYVVNENGDFVWTITAKATNSEQDYAFDLRSSETGRYIKEYVYAVVHPTIREVYYRETGGVLYFTVYTNPGNFDRLRCGTRPSTVGNLANANSFYENYSGEYVWSFRLEKPTETTTLYLDVRDSETGKFIKDYFIFDFVV